MTRLFISYARDDDEPFVETLYRDLIARAFDVWWDRAAMESRGRTFLQEIREAIADADRLILVVGPKAVASDYVQVEWKFALQVCKIVVPILRLGAPSLVPGEVSNADYGLIPDELELLHCPDFRSSRAYGEALDELVRLLNRPELPLAPLHGVDALPPHFVARPEEIDRLRAALLADVSLPTVITSARQTTALKGMGGVGKSVLAAAFARDCATRRAFPDGVIWLKFGQQPPIAINASLVGQAFNEDARRYLDAVTARSRLAEVLADKVSLLVLDDIWAVEHAEVFVNALGARCRLLMTTRDAALVEALGAHLHSLEVLTTTDALTLLAEWAGQTADALPAEARDVARECGNLPLALAMCGAMVRGRPSRWSNVLAKLLAADLSKIQSQFPNYPYPDLLRAIDVSVKALRPRKLRDRYLDLAVFPDGAAVPESVLATLWSSHGLTEHASQDVVDVLVNRSLARRDTDERIVLHDLQRDYVRTHIANLSSVHSGLLSAYAARCPNDWPSGPRDGYFFEHLPRHLLGAGRESELRSLMMNFDWLQAKLEATNISLVISDFDVIAEDDDARVVKDALRLSAHVLLRDKTQLAAQLLGRLLDREEPRLRSLLTRATGWKTTSWLRPVTPALGSPGGAVVMTMVGHADHINDVALAPDGKRVVSASRDSTIKVWDMETGTELRTLRGHESYVQAVAVTPDGHKVLSVSNDKTLRTWDLNSGALLSVLGDHEDVITEVAVIGNGERVICGLSNGALKVWDMTHRSEVFTTPREPPNITALHVTGDGRRAISASGKTIDVWDLRNGERLFRLEGHTESINALALTTDGKKVISASNDGTARVWELEDRTQRATLKGHEWYVNAVAVTPDGRYAVTASADDTVRIWDIQSGKQLRVVGRNAGWVQALVVTPDGRRAISGSWDKTLQVWDLSRTEIRPAPGHKGKVNAVIVAPEARRAVSAAGTYRKVSDHTLRLWDITRGRELLTFNGHDDDVTVAAITPDGQKLVSASVDKTTRIWDVDTGAGLHTLRGHAARINALAMTPDGTRVISGDGAGISKVWDVQTGRELRTLQGHTDAINALAVTPNGRRVLSASDDTTLRLWDLRTGQTLRTFFGHPHWVNAIAITRAGRQAFSAGGRLTPTLMLWDLDEGSRLMWLRGYAPIAVTSNERFVIANSSDIVRQVYTMTVWSLATGKATATLAGHKSDITSVIVIPGNRVVTSAEDTTVRIWDLATGAPVATYTGEAPMLTCAVASDGTTIVAGDESGRVHFLHLEDVAGGETRHA